MKTIVAVIAAIALTPAVAFAAPKPAESIETPASEAQSATSQPRRYCVASTPTGSRLERRECRTLDAWLKDGFDPRAQ